MSSTDVTIDGTDDFDTIARGLRELRADAGGPSYAEIAHRIALDRRARGASASAALPARTTIYDAFRDGRSRINASLVREIVCALGATPSEADEWEARCGRAQRPNAAVAPEPLPEPRPARPTDVIALTTPAPRRALRRSLVLALVIVACIGLNLAGHAMVSLLGLPLFLDMIGTAVVAIAMGPWRGLLVATLSTLALTALFGVDALPFGLVNATGALVWGYGVHRLGLGRSLARFFTLNAVAGVFCTIVAVPVLLLIFDGTTGHASDAIIDNLLAMGEALAPSVFTANLLTSVTDKLLTGFVALAAISMFGRTHVPALEALTGGGGALGSAPRRDDARTDAALPV